MMRSLWTAASGMTSQQLQVDNIANNLANVNTYGFKKERLEFKSLLYQTMKQADLDPANQTGQPVNLQVGLGVRPIATSRYFKTGNFQVTSGNFDFAVDGDGFFAIELSEDNIAYSKDGSFKLSVVDGEGLMLVTSEGYPVLSTEMENIIIPIDYNLDNVTVDSDGIFTYVDGEGQYVDMDYQIALFQFPNKDGLSAFGSNLFKTTAATGEPMLESDGEINKPSRLVQGALEMSNVNVAEEMVDMIVSQRAYELNSKAIQTSDDMLQTANSLKR